MLKNIEQALMNLVNKRAILAWELQQMYPVANIRLEYKPVGVKARIYLDIWMNHGAQDCGRYDYLKDIMRLEHVVQQEKDAVGYAIIVTNDPAYWSEAKSNAVDRALRIPDGRNLNGELSWGEEASAGTMRGRGKRHFAMPKSGQGGTFKSLIVKVKSTI